MTGFGWNSAVVASAGTATFAYPYTGSRSREQIGIFEKNVRGQRISRLVIGHRRVEADRTIAMTAAFRASGSESHASMMTANLGSV